MGDRVLWDQSRGCQIQGDESRPCIQLVAVHCALVQLPSWPRVHRPSPTETGGCGASCGAGSAHGPWLVMRDKSSSWSCPGVEDSHEGRRSCSPESSHRKSEQTCWHLHYIGSRSSWHLACPAEPTIGQQRGQPCGL